MSIYLRTQLYQPAWRLAHERFRITGRARLEKSKLAVFSAPDTAIWQQLLADYAEECHVSKENISLFLLKRIRKLGCCHGVARHLVELQLQEPFASPDELLMHARQQWQQTILFQMAEMFRNAFNKDPNELDQELKLSSSDAERMVYLERRSDLPLHLSHELNAIYLIRLWRDGGKIAHTVTLRISGENRQYWFHNNQKWAGCFSYPGFSQLIAALLQHIRCLRFKPNRFLIEKYLCETKESSEEVF